MTASAALLLASARASSARAGKSSISGIDYDQTCRENGGTPASKGKNDLAACSFGDRPAGSAAPVSPAMQHLGNAAAAGFGAMLGAGLVRPLPDYDGKKYGGERGRALQHKDDDDELDDSATRSAARGVLDEFNTQEAPSSTACPDDPASSA